MYRLTKEEAAFMKKLDTPAKVQKYLDSIPFNFEEEGETCMSPRMVIREKKANCIEGGMFAAFAFMVHGRKPLLLNLKVDTRDDDHVVALFKENGYWGAVSKTNHAVLRFRDPVYRSPRELAMSYFHEYFLVSTGEKTMLGFSKPINMRRFGTAWITDEKDLWNIAEAIFDSEHIPAIPRKNRLFIRRATPIERKAAGIPQDLRREAVKK